MSREPRSAAATQELELASCERCGEPTPVGEPCPFCPAESVDPRLGQVVGERYRVEALLGAGGMGRVYRAEHLGLGEPVAVKFLLGEFASRPEMRARFRREATVLARLRHPGIVSVIDYGEHEGELYLVMEMLHGEALDEALYKLQGPMPAARAVPVIDQVLQVLEAAHAAGVVHRDLKPENVMLVDPGDRTERVKVLDFGIAALLGDDGKVERLTAAGVVRGTPQFMSPEQCVGRGVGPATDIYAAGVILYELLTGATPFDGASVAEVMSQQMFLAPPPFKGAAADVTPALEALVMRALAKRVELRPTASEFRDGLRACARSPDDPAARRVAAGLSREERAISSERTPKVEGPADQASTAPRVALWGFSPERAQTLRMALGAHGVVAFAVPPEAMPAWAPDRSAWRAVVVSGGDKPAARVRGVRGDALLAKVPVLALDLPRAEDAAEIIRAGASDACLARIDDAAACQKVLRALRRGR
ncbi:MAG: serine/threonine-protein kinase [Polyangiales bacterium]